jgi:hypothetical protein
MATFLYDLGRNAFLSASGSGGSGGAIDWLTSTIAATLVSSSYTVASGTDQFYSIIPTGAIAAPSLVALTSKTAAAGVASCASIVFTAVTSGFVVNAVVIVRNTTVAATSNLIAYIDSANATGLPVTSNGSNITINIDTGANHLFKL